jgi:adenylate cyclase
MDHAQFAGLAAWITESGLAGRSETEILAGFCDRAIAVGLPLARAIVLIDTLHPVYEGRAFRWTRDEKETTLTAYGRTNEDLRRWERSPFSKLEDSNESVLRRRLAIGGQDEFSIFPELISQGMTDYVAMVNRFAGDEVIGRMDSVYSSWATDSRSGFKDDDLDDLRRFAPFIALAIKSASLARIAVTLVETYLGHDAGRRVLQGRIHRGVADQIEAVLWFSDLRSYTRIADTAVPEEIIPFLNDYCDVVISAIYKRGGDVLKLIGDGVLAIFNFPDRAGACEAALASAVAAHRGVSAVNQRRAEVKKPITEMYLALHVGEVFYGNIGAKDRLDFTVIGPAVNEVSRIAAMCRSVDQPLLVSAPFAEALGTARDGLVSVGRYALRGVGHPQELFTLESFDRGWVD